MHAASSGPRSHPIAPLDHGFKNRLRRTLRPVSKTMFDVLRVSFSVAATSCSAFLAFIFYYYDSFLEHPSRVVLFFQPADNRYLYLALIAGLVFAGITLIFQRQTVRSDGFDLLRDVCTCWTLTMFALLTLLFVLKIGDNYSRGLMSCWFVIGVVALLLARTLEQRISANLTDAGIAQRWVAIVGATPQADQLAERLAMADLRSQFRVVGIFDDRAEAADGDGGTVPIAGTIDDLIALHAREPLDTIVIALPGDDVEPISLIAARFRALTTDIVLGPDLAQLKLHAKPVKDLLGPLPVASLSNAPMRDWPSVAKWLEDRLIALAALIVTAPLFALIALLIKLDSDGPVFFRQRRLGFDNNEFLIFKFRTMYQHSGDPSGALATQRFDRRVTRIGRFLRRTSIDELPQLINVLLGDMSIVGPRPHPVAMRLDNQLIAERLHDYAARHRVKPGITGLAQVNGNRGEIDSREKAEQRIYFDLLYIENWSLWLDFEIVVRTIFQLPFDRSAY
ncbi:MAG: undecaprenyl-phosphate glucose phosphotransferase [Alphaproteobacteria bacterium]